MGFTKVTIPILYSVGDMGRILSQCFWMVTDEFLQSQYTSFVFCWRCGNERSYQDFMIHPVQGKNEGKEKYKNWLKHGVLSQNIFGYFYFAFSCLSWTVVRASGEKLSYSELLI